MLIVCVRFPQIREHDPAHQQFEKLGNIANATVIRYSSVPVTLENGSMHVSNDLLKSIKTRNANTEAQFFRISVGILSGNGPLLPSSSNNAFSTSETVNWNKPKGGSSFTRSILGLDGTHESSAYVCLINCAKRSQFLRSRCRLTFKTHNRWIAHSLFLEINVPIKLLESVLMAMIIMLLIFSPQRSKIVPKSFTVPNVDIIVNHAPLLAFFIFFAAFVALFFKPIDSFVTHGNF
jgi:hypothetical protein